MARRVETSRMGPSFAEREGERNPSNPSVPVRCQPDEASRPLDLSVRPACERPRAYPSCTRTSRRRRVSPFVAFNARRIRTLLERVLREERPMPALEALTELRHDLDLLERAQVARALQEGETFTSIAKPLAISRQAAHRRYRDLVAASSARAVARLSVDGRAALIRAREEAARYGSADIESEHLLLAVAQLSPLGLDVEAARRTFGRPPMRASEPGGLSSSLRARLARS